jgi:uncharacterized protein
MLYERYFPLGLAQGQTFLGRSSELTLLQRNIKSGRHTLLIAPRKYGKTSLIKEAIKKVNYPSVDIDFFLIVDEKSIESKLLKAVSKLLKDVSPQPERWITGLVKYFKIQNKQWTIGIKGLSLQLSPEQDSDVAENILDALNAAEYLLMKKKQKAVLFIDEAQEISKVNNSQSIEGAIRNFAQQAKYLVIIFSGSNQHMLSHMFGDESRPLYDLCDRVPLDRLSPQVYQPYLNKISKQTWNEPLNNAVFESLMAISECHPKIVYALCKKLWDYCTSKNRGPGVRDVQHVWETYLKLRLKDIKLMLSKLSAGQLNLLIQIALNKHQHITGKAMQSILGISSSAIVQAIAALERHDFIEEISINDYRIIDPSIKSILLKDYKD